MSKKSKKSGEKPSKIKKVEVTDESEPEPEDYDPTASWDCTVCTFKNRFEAFKCEICDTRKGTSTRKPRVNSNVVQQQALVQSLAMDKAHKRQRLSTRGHTPDSIEAGPSSVGGKRESSVSSNIAAIPDIGSPSSSSSRDKDAADAALQKREKLRDSLIFRDSAKKYDITDDSGITITITSYKGRNHEKELRYLNALKEVEKLQAAQNEKIEKTRAEHETQKKEFEEKRAKQRAERAAKPKKTKKVKKPKAPKKTPKVKTPKSAVFKTPTPRGRPSTKTPKSGGSTRGGKTSTPSSSKRGGKQ
uniref:RanBP2-type domain-containing protein n=1 Tax=Panagrolaimus davidi TaxID=227884 RepID=A0A914Q0N9_9BILA